MYLSGLCLNFVCEYLNLARDVCDLLFINLSACCFKFFGSDFNDKFIDHYIRHVHFTSYPFPDIISEMAELFLNQPQNYHAILVVGVGHRKLYQHAYSCIADLDQHEVFRESKCISCQFLYIKIQLNKTLDLMYRYCSGCMQKLFAKSSIKVVG